jgi:hypothetical protein
MGDNCENKIWVESAEVGFIGLLSNEEFGLATSSIDNRGCILIFCIGI